MKIIKLMGGLGNQMFQYAFSKALSEDVLFDISYFETDNKKFGIRNWVKFNLSDFNVSTIIATKEQIEKCLNENFIATKLLYIEKYFHINPLFSNRVFEKDSAVFYPEFLSLKGDTYFDCYFQNEKYFLPYREILLKEFTPKNAFTAENQKISDRIQNTNSVAISIRQGKDFVKLNWQLNKEYYDKAIQIIQDRVENPHFYIFTDNIEWAKENIAVKAPITFANSLDDNAGYTCGIDLMSKCKHIVMANSTYSWWGAWLNQNDGKIVVSPKNNFKGNLNTFKNLIIL